MSTSDPLAHVLLVDDNEDGRIALCEVLEVVGYRVSTADSGKGALALLDTDHFDAVVLDLGLPDLDGLDVLRAIRSRPRPPAALVFTGFHRPRADAEQAGCDAFVLKPDLEGLIARLRDLLTARSDRPEIAAKVRKGV